MIRTERGIIMSTRPEYANVQVCNSRSCVLVSNLTRDKDFAPAKAYSPIKSTEAEMLKVPDNPDSRNAHFPISFKFGDTVTEVRAVQP